MGVAVQVFHNLGTLTDTVLTTVKGCSNNIQQQTQDALNPATLTEGECAFANNHLNVHFHFLSIKIVAEFTKLN